MVKQQSVIFLENQETKLFQNFNIVKNKFDEEGIHQLRLNIKRIRAYLRLFEYITDGKICYKIMYQRFRNIFKTCGRIREMQLMEEYLTDYQKKLKKSYSFLTKYCKNIENVNRFYFLETFELEKIKVKLDITKKIEKEIYDLSEQLIVAKTQKYIHEKLDWIFELCQYQPHDETVHSARKSIKEIIYIYEIFKKSPVIEKSISATIKPLKDIENHIGLWHDRIVFNRKIELIIKVEHDNRKFSRKNIALLQKRIETDNKILLEQVISKIAHLRDSFIEK